VPWGRLCVPRSFGRKDTGPPTSGASVEPPSSRSTSAALRELIRSDFASCELGVGERDLVVLEGDGAEPAAAASPEWMPIRTHTSTPSGQACSASMPGLPRPPRRVGRAAEGDEERVALRVDLLARLLAEKPAYRSLLGSHRCLVVADGFYESTVGPTGRSSRSTGGVPSITRRLTASQGSR
jgi:hypothetical protein